MGERKTNEKRALQNRIAQKSFRQRQNEQVKLLKLKEQEFDLLVEKHKEQLQLIMELQNMNTQLLKEKEQMVHIMDRLRNENQMYKQNSMGRNGNIGNNYIPKPKGNYGTVFVKGMGTFGKMRPPFESCRESMKWTGLENTFISESTRKRVDYESTTTSINKNESKTRIMEHNDESTIESTRKSTENDSLLENHSKLVWKDNNEYPGFPQWAPINPTVTTLQLVPYHLQFSYSDSPATHNVFSNDWDIFLPSSMYQMPLLHHIPFEQNPLLDFEFIYDPLANPFVPMADSF